MTDQEFEEFYPMRSKSEAPCKLDEFCKTYGIPRTLLTDNEPEETRGEWENVVKQYLISQRMKDPHSGWQNRAEVEIREVKNIIAGSCTGAVVQKVYGAMEWSIQKKYAN
jgi:hypothetical protein